jgi:hypothetical protein
MRSEKLLPFDWEQCDQQDALCFTFYQSRWREDFGPFKAGELVGCLTVDFSECKATDDDTGKVVMFRAVPV